MDLASWRRYPAVVIDDQPIVWNRLSCLPDCFENSSAAFNQECCELMAVFKGEEYQYGQGESFPPCFEEILERACRMTAERSIAGKIQAKFGE